MCIRDSQYGQHCVEYLYDGDEEGVYYLAIYNNNYWSLNSRDDFDLELADSVGTDLYGLGDETSQVYVYKIDENNGTFALDSSFAVSYTHLDVYKRQAHTWHRARCFR